MRAHHTKNKGDLAVLHAQVDLAEKGYRILLPLTEHEYFDLVAYKDSRFIRIQVKYRTAKDGVINVSFKSWWADRHGCHKLLMDKDMVDLVCVYCPNTRRCYYIDPRRYGQRACLRLEPVKNGQRKRVSLADDFIEIPDPLAQLD